MKTMQKMFMGVLADYINDHGLDGAFDALFPNREVLEVFYEMYESGLIPEDVMEDFLND